MIAMSAVLAALSGAAAGAGCGRAGAAPERSSGITPPPGWQSMATVATTARLALGPKTEVEGAEAWGEPAMGCYAVWLALRASGTAEAVGKQVVAGFTGAAGAADAAGSGSGSSSGARLIVKDVVAPTGDEGVLTLAFERGDHRGRLRARLGGGKIAALACFANQREPLACEAACTKLLGAQP
jgi:hypothetical protein